MNEKRSIIITVVAWRIAYTFHFVTDCTPEMKSEIWHRIARKKKRACRGRRAVGTCVGRSVGKMLQPYMRVVSFGFFMKAWNSTVLFLRKSWEKRREIQLYEVCRKDLDFLLRARNRSGTDLRERENNIQPVTNWEEQSFLFVPGSGVKFTIPGIDPSI